MAKKTYYELTIIYSTHDWVWHKMTYDEALMECDRLYGQIENDYNDSWLFSEFRGRKVRIYKSEIVAIGFDKEGE